MTAALFLSLYDRDTGQMGQNRKSVRRFCERKMVFVKGENALILQL